MNGISATRETLKQVFKPGAKPTGRDFARLFDSFVHLTEDGVSVLPERPAVKVGEIQLQGSDAGPAILFGGENRWKLGVNLLEEERSGGSISFTHGENPTPTLHLTGDGKVGIGTAEPDTTLTIEGGDEAIRLYSGNDRKDSSIAFFCSGGPGSERSGWIGYRNEQGPDFSIENEQPGAIVLTSGAHVAVNSQLQVNNGSSTSEPGGGFITVGQTRSRHLALDDTGIQAKNENGGQTILEVQPAGGETRFGGKVVIGPAKPDTALTIEGGGEAIRLYSGNDRKDSSIGFFCNGGPGSERSGSIGYPNDVNRQVFTIENHENGPIRIVCQSDQHVDVESQMQVTGGDGLRGNLPGVMTGGRLMVGKQKGPYQVFDGEIIQVFDKTKASDLRLQGFGGNTVVGRDLYVQEKIYQKSAALLSLGMFVLSASKKMDGYIACDGTAKVDTSVPSYADLFNLLNDNLLNDASDKPVKPMPNPFTIPKLKPLSVGGLKLHFFVYAG